MIPVERSPINACSQVCFLQPPKFVLIHRLRAELESTDASRHPSRTMSSENTAILPANQVCHRCLGAIQNLEDIEIHRKSTIYATLNISHHATFNALKDAAELGCRLCRVVWRKLSKHCQSALLDDENAVISKLEHYHWDDKQSCATKLSLQSYTNGKGDLGANIRVTFTGEVDLLGDVSTLPLYTFLITPVNSLSG